MHRKGWRGREREREVLGVLPIQGQAIMVQLCSWNRTFIAVWQFLARGLLLGRAMRVVVGVVSNKGGDASSIALPCPHG